MSRRKQHKIVSSTPELVDPEESWFETAIDEGDIVEDAEDDSDVIQTEEEPTIQRVCLLVNDSVEHMLHAGAAAKLDLANDIVDVAIYGTTDRAWLLSKTGAVNAVFGFSELATGTRKYAQYDRLIAFNGFGGTVSNRTCRYETLDLAEHNIDCDDPIFKFEIAPITLPKFVVNSVLVGGSVYESEFKRLGDGGKSLITDYGDYCKGVAGSDSVVMLSLDGEHRYTPFMGRDVGRMHTNLKTAAVCLMLSRRFVGHEKSDLWWLATGLGVSVRKIEN